MLFRVLLLACTLSSAPASAFDLEWILESMYVVDPPEELIATSPYIPLGEARYKPVYSEVNGLLYLGLYTGRALHQRAYKLGPLPLLSRGEYDRSCGIRHRWLDVQALGNQLHLVTFKIDCRGATFSRYLVLDGSTGGEPWLAVGHMADDQVLLQPLRPLPAERREVWQRWITAYGERNRLPEWTSINLMPSPPPEDAVEALRRLHAEAFRNQGTPQSLMPLRELLLRHDYRQLGLHEADAPRLLNDTAFWLSEAGLLAEARPLLLEVLRRDPQRTPAYLNLADLDWRLHKQQPYDARHPARAREYYRMYCSLRLAGGQSVPRRVLESLQLPKASASECQPHWPLLDAVRAGDLTKVRTLLQAGIPGQVVGDDGYSALLLALQTPKLDIAELLISHGARLHGLHGHQLAEHALQRDLKDNAPWPRLRFLALYGTVLDTPDTEGVTLLMKLAADRSARDAFDEVLKLTQDLDRQTGDGMTALHRASKAENFPAVNALLAAGADPNIEFNDRLYCRTGAAHYTAIQLFARSLSSDADVNASRESFRQLLKHGSQLAAGQRCAFNGHDALLESLILAQRADLMRLLAEHAVLPTPAPALLDIARDQQQRARSAEQHERAQEVMNALLDLGEPPLRSAL
jgi:ankyrin repeat protein